MTKAQDAPPHPRQFPPGTLTRIEDVPAGRFRTRLDSLSPAARGRALERLRSFHFTELDLNSLDADADGGVFYVDKFELAPAAADSTPSEPVVAQAAVPVNPLPASLFYHSKPGAPNVIFLNFSGENVSGTGWNTSVGRSVIPAVAFSTDTDLTTFNDSEQLIMKRIWQRVAEDYAPFDVDVTTERPATFGLRVAHALVTRHTDANGLANPSSTAGGISYVNVFGDPSYASYRPCWIYYDNLAYAESYIGEATSHEVGHNLGLSHDGTSTSEYYGGHGSGDISWGPIMGASYGRNVTQWSRGEYYLANNGQDDLAIIGGKLGYRADDHGATAATATPLVITGTTNIVSTTSDKDPANTNHANKGILEHNTDVDVFSFTTGAGAVKLAVNPWFIFGAARGGNVDVSIELRNSANALLAANNSPTQTIALIQTTVPAGTYYLYVRSSAAGDPFAATPSGYTSYASVGQYFISGYVAPDVANAPIVQLTTSVNNPGWGTVSPTNGSYSAGSTVQLTATPTPYYKFECWTNGAVGSSDPMSLVLNTNVSVQAVFSELMTTNNPTPYSWLASFGYTSNFENAAAVIGANGMPLWQSYVAGLNPSDPASQLRLAITHGAAGNVLNWNTVIGRVYTLLWSTNAARGFTTVPGATNLPATTHALTNNVNAPAAFYRLQVAKP